MKTEDVQTRLDAVAKAMSGRTKTESVCLWLDANVTPRIYVRHNPKFTKEYRDEVSVSFQFGRDGSTVEAILDAADAWASSLPTRDEAERAAFMDKLGDIIEHGKRIGIEDGFVNPLLDMMKKLSENAITHQVSL